MKLKCYYAHPMSTYNSRIEKQDLELLEKLGFEVLNPNQMNIQEEMNEYIKVHGRDKVMDYFNTLIDECDLVAFRGNPDNTILSGVASEISYTLEVGKPVIELPCSLKRRMLNYPETKTYLLETGFYK